MTDFPWVDTALTDPRVLKCLECIVNVYAWKLHFWSHSIHKLEEASEQNAQATD